MSTKTSLNRRGFVALNAAGVTAAALPSAALSATNTAEMPAPVARFDWATSDATELSAHIGRRFRFRDADGHSTVMRLVDVEAVDSGPDRPQDLPRKAGVIAVFDGPDAAPLIDAGQAHYQVEAAGLGRAHVMAGPVPRRAGGHLIEIVLN